MEYVMNPAGDILHSKSYMFNECYIAITIDGITIFSLQGFDPIITIKF